MKASTEPQHLTILDTVTSRDTWAPWQSPTGSCFLTADTTAWLSSSSGGGFWGVQGLLLPRGSPHTLGMQG